MNRAGLLQLDELHESKLSLMDRELRIIAQLTQNFREAMDADDRLAMAACFTMLAMHADQLSRRSFQAFEQFQMVMQTMYE